MCFLRAKTEEDYMSIAQTHPAISEAYERINVLSADEPTRTEAAAREKNRMDLDSLLYDARQEGLQEGEQKGIYRVARHALRKKMSHDAIVELTGLSLEEVNRLAAGLTG
jgi:predicted transposase/invertase (TIGR01784 family)